MRAPPIAAVLCVVTGLLLLPSATGQTVIESRFLPLNGTYSDPANWSPAEVPNNTGERVYNIEVGPERRVEVDVDATVANLTLRGWCEVVDSSFAVTDTTATFDGQQSSFAVSGFNAAARFDLGTLTAFDQGTLRGGYSVQSSSGAATLQFNGANVAAVRDGGVALYGRLARLTDEHGNDGLRNLARVESSASFSVERQHFVTQMPLTIDGSLRVGEPDEATGGSFTAAGGLTNFDAATRTLRGGSFTIGYSDDWVRGTAGDRPVEFRFNSADIVRNASSLSLIGPASRITDLAGRDALQNFAHNMEDGVVTLHTHTLVTPGSFTNDGRLLLDDRALFAITGRLTNFDAVTGTLSGGTYHITRGSTLKFSDADIVRNATSLLLSQGSRVTDHAGNNALRNFAVNLETGSFTLAKGQVLTVSDDFTNAGQLEIHGRVISTREMTPAAELTLPPGSRYMQTAGVTQIDGVLNAATIEIRGGTMLGRGVLNGNAVIGDVAIGPMAFDAKLNGNLTLGTGSQLRTSGVSLAISGTAALAGTLRIDLPANSYLASDAVYTILQTDGAISGTFSNAPHGARVPTADGTGSFVVVYEAKAVKLTQFQAEPPAAQLVNISTRGHLHRTSEDASGQRTVLIGGFIIYGSQPKTVVLRAIGPSLGSSGVPSALTDPTLVLHSADGNVLASNDNWQDAQQSELATSGLAPRDEREAAIMTTLAPGLYTAVLREKDGSGGTGLVEVYDLSRNSSSKLANISTRGFVDPANLLIGGVIAEGDGQGNSVVVVRAIGPQLARSGVPQPLEDPTLELRDRDGQLVASNDNWTSNWNDIPGELQAQNRLESAMRISLPRGYYTAVVRGKENAGGMALVEFYDLRR